MTAPGPVDPGEPPDDEDTETPDGDDGHATRAVDVAALIAKEVG